MTPFGILIIAAFAIVGVPAPNPHPGTKFCQECHGVRDIATCTQFRKCHNDEVCFTDVRLFQGDNYFFKGCKKTHECDALINNAVPVGKRAFLPHEKDLLLLCEDCCYADRCNTIGCDLFGTTTTAATTVAPTAAPTAATPTLPPSTVAPVTTSGNTCRDHEEDGFNCTDYDQYKFCTVTDPNALSYVIAHNKCPKHCGLCVTTTAAPPTTTTSSVVCRDHEEDGTLCVDYDKYNFCTDVNSLAHALAFQKCPKHCGFCGQNPTTSSGGSAVTLTSNHPTMTPTPTTTTNGLPLLATVVISQGSTAKPCADFEDATFSCASWASNGFCTSPTGVLHEITVMRCSKYCNLC